QSRDPRPHAAPRGTSVARGARASRARDRLRARHRPRTGPHRRLASREDPWLPRRPPTSPPGSALSATASGSARRRWRARRPPSGASGSRGCARRDAIVAAAQADLGRPALETELAEIHPALAECDHAIRHVARWMRPERVRTPPLLFGTSSRIEYAPRGVVLILAPWNYPFGLAVNPLVAAIAAGNCAVCKPSEKAPRTSALVAELVGATFDPAEVAVVEGGPDTAAALVELP